MIHLMLADPGIDTADLSALRMVCFGGAPVAEAFLTRGGQAPARRRFANVWGLTEATSIVTCALGQEWLDRPWSVGRPVPGIEVAVAIDEQVVDPDPDAVGELWVRGPAVTAGYWGRPEATAQTFGAAGWLRTGDIGRADAEGYVQVLDRMKDMIIRGGENIYSLEVESVIARHPAVAEVAVVGVPNAVFGERVRVVAVLREGASLPIADPARVGRHPARRLQAARGTGHGQRTAPQCQRQGHQEATGRAVDRNSARECEPMNAVMQTGRMPHARDAAEPERVSGSSSDRTVHARPHPQLSRDPVLTPRLPCRRHPRAGQRRRAVHVHAVPLLPDQAGHPFRDHQPVPARVH